MPLVKSPTMTPAKLAANRANALKSTGPRTARGKAHVTLNALRHGGRCRASTFREQLAGNGEDAALYDWIYQQVVDRFNLSERSQLNECATLARRVWCHFRDAARQCRERARAGAAWAQAEMPSTTSSLRCSLRLPKRIRGGKLRAGPQARRTERKALHWSNYKIPVGRTGVRLTFWVCSKRRHTPPPKRSLMFRLLNWIDRRVKPGTNLDSARSWRAVYKLRRERLERKSFPLGLGRK